MQQSPEAASEVCALDFDLVDDLDVSRTRLAYLDLDEVDAWLQGDSRRTPPRYACHDWSRHLTPLDTVSHILPTDSAEV